MPMIEPPRELNGVDRRIWTEELEPFVPERVFDVHTHCYRWEFNTDPAKETGPFGVVFGQDFPEGSRAGLDAWDAVVLPGRRMHRLSFGFPFPTCDFDASNRFAAEQVSQDPESGALMLVHPSMSCDYVEEQIRECGFLGLKPYLFYARSGDTKDCRITDFLPEEQIDLAHRRGLLITLHVSKRDAMADPSNIEDVVRLTTKYHGAKWILAHCGRSYSTWALEPAIERLRGLSNVWYDVSSVCDSSVIAMLIDGVGPERVMYGSDNFPNGFARGTFVTFGYAWGILSEKNHSLDLSHCNPQMTFVMYEQLRAMRRASVQLGLDRAQIEDLFYNTAARLIQSV